jgi:hypothetical protein
MMYLFAFTHLISNITLSAEHIITGAMISRKEQIFLLFFALEFMLSRHNSYLMMICF